jgi:hypothetical protein
MLNFIKKSEKPTEKDIVNTRNNGTDSTSSVKKSSDNFSSRSNSNCSKSNIEKIRQSYDLWLQLYKPITSKDLAMHYTRVSYLIMYEYSFIFKYMCKHTGYAFILEHMYTQTCLYGFNCTFQ